MVKKILLICFLFTYIGTINAQNWSKEDSIWLKNVLEGKEDFTINENTKKAIEDGRLIIPDWMKNNENKLNDIEILKNFDDAGAKDSLTTRNVDPYSMPPAVFALYVLYMDHIDSVYNNTSLVLSSEEKRKLESLLPTGTVQSFAFRTSNYSPGATFVTDFNHLLSIVFSPAYRRKAYNSKHATAYKNYYDNGIVKPFGFTELERKQIRNAVKSINVKLNPIDD